MSEKARVQINYKSGISMEVEVEEFSVKRNKINGAASFEWKSAVPRSLLLGADDIESLWELP